LKIRNQILLGLTIVGCISACKKLGDSQYENDFKSKGKSGSLFGAAKGESPTEGMDDKGGKDGKGATGGGDDTSTGGGDFTTGSTTGATTGATTGTSTVTTTGNEQPPPLDCTKDTAIVDPDAAFSWRGILRAGDDIDRFINPIAKITTKMRVGALRYTPENATFVCHLHGYASGAQTEAGSFKSPGNNNIYQWNSSTKKLDAANASKSNVTLRGISCKGKLDDRCVQDQTWLLGP
jgi:hypothetical protein